jgi:exodeoxyribonuclease-1
MLFRYRARNWPDTLSREERQRWDTYRKQRLTGKDAGSSITLDDFGRQLAQIMVDPALGEREKAILSQLADWPAAIGLR